MRLRPLLLLAAASAAALAACGPSETQVRKAVRTSAHRTLAVLPFDYRGGERNAAPQVGDAFERRLRGDGFQVYDRGKTRAVYARSLDARTGAYDAVMRTAELGAALGVSAVVVGSADNAFEEIERRPAEFRWNPVLRRRELVSPALARRRAGASVRVRFVESGSGRVLWEAHYGATLEGFGLGQVADQVAGVLHEQLSDAILQGRL